MNQNLFFTPTDILLPAHADMRRWSVIACDQFTADAGYWQAVQDTVGDAPSTLRLMLPEFYLGKCDEAAATREIQQTMRRYLDDGVFRTVPYSLVLVQRTLPGGTVRCGIVGALDLEAYDYAPDSVLPGFLCFSFFKNIFSSFLSEKMEKAEKYTVFFVFLALFLVARSGCLNIILNFVMTGLA